MPNKKSIWIFTERRGFISQRKQHTCKFKSSKIQEDPAKVHNG